MVKSIILHLDETFFFKMKEDKLRRERELNEPMTWEVYVAIIFGASKIKK